MRQEAYFQHDLDQYALSGRYWIDLWEQVDPRDRSRFGWRRPWFQPLPPLLGEGNPILQRRLARAPTGHSGDPAPSRPSPVSKFRRGSTPSAVASTIPTVSRNS